MGRSGAGVLVHNPVIALNLHNDDVVYLAQLNNVAGRPPVAGPNQRNPRNTPDTK